MLELINDVPLFRPNSDFLSLLQFRGTVASHVGLHPLVEGSTPKS